MTDKVFIDTNVLIYYISNDNKKNRAREILFSENRYISVQIINEFINVCFKKSLIDETRIKDLAEKFIISLNPALINHSTILNAFYLKQKYKYSYWDSLIISSALENDCTILYTEDMQHGQMIEDSLEIINPFL